MTQDLRSADATAHTEQFLDEVTAAARRHNIKALIVAGVCEDGERMRPTSRAMLESGNPGIVAGVAVMGAAMSAVRSIEKAVRVPIDVAEVMMEEIKSKTTHGERKPS